MFNKISIELLILRNHQKTVFGLLFSNFISNILQTAHELIRQALIHPITFIDRHSNTAQDDYK